MRVWLHSIVKLFSFTFIFTFVKLFYETGIKGKDFLFDLSEQDVLQERWTGQRDTSKMYWRHFL